MGSRRKARESALQVLFQLEFDESDSDKVLDQYWKGHKESEDTQEFCRLLVQGILSHRVEIDTHIESTSQHWRVSRMAHVDRNILRMAVYELLYEKELAPAIVIDEALEIAKKFGSQETSKFVNGILDAIRKKMDN